MMLSRTVRAPMLSPLAEGRELKSVQLSRSACRLPSPLAEGRELKYGKLFEMIADAKSPLAEGRELKCGASDEVVRPDFGRPSRRGVN